MTDVLVTLNIPESMHEELERLVEKKHFMDLTELVKEVIRKKVLPKDEKQELVNQLENLLSQLKN